MNQVTVFYKDFVMYNEQRKIKIIFNVVFTENSMQ